MMNKLYVPLYKLFILLSLSLLPLLSSQAQIIHYVKPSPVGAGDGTSWANATSDLQAAINSLTATGGQVWVAAGLYKPTASTSPGSQTISFSMKSKVAIYGGFTGNETTLSERQVSHPSSTTLSGNLGNESLDTDNSYRVFTSFRVDSTGLLDGFVITAGNANAADYYYQSGGGMFFQMSSAHLNNCLFVANSGQEGGAIMISSEANNLGAETFFPLLTNCSFQNNSAGLQGGGISLTGSNTNTTLTLINCSFVGNSAKAIAVGYFRVNNNIKLINCSFQGNLAGAIDLKARVAGISAQLTNCVLFNNGGSNTFFSNLGPLTIKASYCLFDESVTGYSSDGTNLTTSTSPFISAISTQLAPSSPAINAGNPASTTATSGSTDLAGNPRFFQGGTVDMGAYEYQAEIIGVADLTPILYLPQGNFAASGPESIHNLTMTLSEQAGTATSGVIVLTLTAPLGYSLGFDPTLTSINVTGGTTNPVNVNNAIWEVRSQFLSQMTLTSKTGQGIGPRGVSVIGLSLTRSPVASAGTANLTVNVNDDPTGQYDSNPANNIYARILNAL